MWPKNSQPCQIPHWTYLLKAVTCLCSSLGPVTAKQLLIYWHCIMVRFRLGCLLKQYNAFLFLDPLKIKAHHHFSSVFEGGAVMKQHWVYWFLWKCRTPCDVVWMQISLGSGWYSFSQLLDIYHIFLSLCHCCYSWWAKSYSRFAQLIFTVFNCSVFSVTSHLSCQTSDLSDTWIQMPENVHTNVTYTQKNNFTLLLLFHGQQIPFHILFNKLCGHSSTDIVASTILPRLWLSKYLEASFFNCWAITYRQLIHYTLVTVVCMYVV